MVAHAAIPGLVLCFVAMVLLIVVSVSAPVSNLISFLDANIGGREIHFGEYGYTGSGRSIGYTVNDTAIGLSDKLLSVATIKNLTRALVLHTVAACILFVAVLQGTCACVNYSRIHTIFMGFTMSFSLIFIIIAFAVDLVLFDLIAERIRADAPENSAHLGAATWLTLTAMILVIVGCCAAGYGAFGNYHDERFRDGHHHRRRRRHRSRRYDSRSPSDSYDSY